MKQSKDRPPFARCNTCLTCPDRLDCSCGRDIPEPPCAEVCERETCEGCPPEGIVRRRPKKKVGRITRI
jgi:hypothetical protein